MRYILYFPKFPKFSIVQKSSKKSQEILRIWGILHNYCPDDVVMSNIALIFGSRGHKFSKNICPSFRLAGYLYKFFSLSLSSMAPWPYLARAVFLLYDSHVLKSFYIFVEKLQPAVG